MDCGNWFRCDSSSSSRASKSRMWCHMCRPCVVPSVQVVGGAMCACCAWCHVHDGLLLWLLGCVGAAACVGACMDVGAACWHQGPCLPYVHNTAGASPSSPTTIDIIIPPVFHGDDHVTITMTFHNDGDLLVRFLLVVALLQFCWLLQCCSCRCSCVGAIQALHVRGACTAGIANAAAYATLWNTM